MAQSDENMDIFTGRLQLVAVKTRNGERDRLSLEFDFDESSTGEDVLEALLPQIADSYRLEDPSEGKHQRSGGGGTTTTSGIRVDAFEVRLRDAPEVPPFPLTRPLLEHPNILALFLQRRNAATSDNPRKIPTFVLQPKLCQPSSDTTSSADARVASNGANTASATFPRAAGAYRTTQQPSNVTSERTNAAALVGGSGAAGPVERQQSSPAPASMGAADTSLGVVLLDSSALTKSEADDNMRERTVRTEKKHSASGEEPSAHAAAETASPVIATSVPPSQPVVTSLRASVEAAMKEQSSSVESMLSLWLGPPSERAHILSQLPIEPEYLAQADELLEEFNFELKDLRMALRDRIHWVHLIPRTPQRGDWLTAMETEEAASRSYAASLAAKRDDQRQALRMVQLRLAELRQKNEALQIDGIRAREAIKRRDALQTKLDGLRGDAEELRSLEVQLQERMRRKLSELYASSPQRASHERNAKNVEESPAKRTAPLQATAGESSSTLVECTGGGRGSSGAVTQQQRQPSSFPAAAAADGAARVDEGDNTCFDDDGLALFGRAGREASEAQASSRSTVDYQFLSPNLRDSVKQVLETPVVLAGASASATAPSGSSQQDDLQALAAQLSQYLNGASPDPEARQKLLTEVRRVRDAVERHRSSPRSTGTVSAADRSVDASAVRHQYDVRSLPDVAPASNRSYETSRWAPGVSPLSDSRGTVVSTTRRPATIERRTPSMSTSTMEATSSAMAEFAVPFFQRL